MTGKIYASDADKRSVLQSSFNLNTILLRCARSWEMKAVKYNIIISKQMILFP